MNSLQRWVLIGLILASPCTLIAAEDGKKTPEEQKKVEAPQLPQVVAQKPVYKPPLRGAPAGRVGGGTRGANERESFALMVLAPDHIGYTLKEQPCLYWYISKATSFPVEVTLTERHAVQPLLEKVIQGPQTGGIQSVCLADYGVRLQPDIPYKWFITLVTDSGQRSKDILAGGMLARVPPSAALQERMKVAAKDQVPSLYAEEGLWYDAVEAMARQIGDSPNDAGLREQLAALLAQVGLAEIGLPGTIGQP